jgi:hypothetical protein
MYDVTLYTVYKNAFYDNSGKATRAEQVSFKIDDKFSFILTP